MTGNRFKIYLSSVFIGYLSFSCSQKSYFSPHFLIIVANKLLANVCSNAWTPRTSYFVCPTSFVRMLLMALEAMRNTWLVSPLWHITALRYHNRETTNTSLTFSLNSNLTLPQSFCGFIGPASQWESHSFPSTAWQPVRACYKTLRSAFHRSQGAKTAKLFSSASEAWPSSDSYIHKLKSTNSSQ